MRGNLCSLQSGLNMLVYLGLMSQENMQIEGFWYYLFSGVFEAAPIHYAAAQIFGPPLFAPRLVRLCLLDSHGLRAGSRSKCRKSPAEKKLGTLRYVRDVLRSRFALVSALFLMKFLNLERIMLWLKFLIGRHLFLMMPAASRSRFYF